MKLSALQRFILKQCYAQKNGILPRDEVLQYYTRLRRNISRKIFLTTVINSFNRLISAGLLVGYGWQTARKWHIHKVRLTAQGWRTARQLHGQQQKLPIK